MVTYYSIYQTTNLVNGKTYIGAHVSNDPWDDYMGSGKTLRKAIQKHGRQSFTKEVLAVFDNPEDMWATEKRLVTEEWTRRRDTYNIVIGGCGNSVFLNTHPLRVEWSSRSSKGWTEDGKIKIKETGKTNGAKAGRLSHKLGIGIHAQTSEQRAAAARLANHRVPKPSLLGHNASAEARQRMSEAAKRRHQRNREQKLLDAELGFEPRLTVSETAILPLDDSAL